MDALMFVLVPWFRLKVSLVILFDTAMDTWVFVLLLWFRLKVCVVAVIQAHTAMDTWVFVLLLWIRLKVCVVAVIQAHTAMDKWVFVLLLWFRLKVCVVAVIQAQGLCCYCDSGSRFVLLQRFRLTRPWIYECLCCCCDSGSHGHGYMNVCVVAVIQAQGVAGDPVWHGQLPHRGPGSRSLAQHHR